MTTSHELATHLFLQLSVLLATCRLVGWGLRRVGQTEVVSDMISGVLLGPSFLGLLAPEPTGLCALHERGRFNWGVNERSGVDGITVGQHWPR